MGREHPAGGARLISSRRIQRNLLATGVPPAMGPLGGALTQQPRLGLHGVVARIGEVT
jgi:hypothetical protein